MSISGVSNNFNATIDGLTNFQLSDLNIDTLAVNNNTQLSGMNTINGLTTFTGNVIVNANISLNGAVSIPLYIRIVDNTNPLYYTQLSQASTAFFILNSINSGSIYLQVKNNIGTLIDALSIDSTNTTIGTNLIVNAGNLNLTGGDFNITSKKILQSGTITGQNTFLTSYFNGNVSLRGANSIFLYNTANTISTRIYQNGATLTFTNPSAPSQYLFQAYDGFGALYSYTFGSTFSCGADITLNNYNLVLSGTANIDQSASTGVNTLKNTTFSSGSVISQYDSTNAVYTSLSQTDTSTYLIENMYNTSTITLRNKNAVGTSIEHSYAYNKVSLGSLLQMGANLDIILQGTGRIDQTTGTGQNIFNTLKFNNSTSNKQITLYQVSGTNVATNYTISVEPFILRYNADNGASHYFSTGTGVSTYTNHAIINSTGLTMGANRNVVQSGTGILSQSGSSGINLMKSITLNANQNLLQSGIGVITQSGTGTNALKGSTFSGSNIHYNGSLITQYDSTNTYNTSIGQSGADYSISNNTGGSMFLNANIVYLTNSYTTLKGGTSVSGYATHFPYTDGVNYITGQTVMRSGSVEIPDGPLVLRNETSINLFDAEPTPNQCSVFCTYGDLRFDNYTDPLITSGGGNIKFKTYNLTTPIPRFHVRLNINYDGIQVKKGHLEIYNDDETSYLQADQTTTTSTIKNTAVSGSMILQTTDSGGSAVSNITMTSTNTTIDTILTCNKNITLQSTFITPSLGQLGYKVNGSYRTTPAGASWPIFLTSNAVNWLAEISLPTGLWNVVGQLYYYVFIGGNIISEQYSISPSQSTIDNDNLLVFGANTSTTGSNMVRRINTIITNTSPSNVSYYLTLNLNHSSGTPQWILANQATYVRFYAVRIA